MIGGFAGRGVDARDVAAGERGVVDRAVRGRGDAVRPAALRILIDRHLSGRGIERSVDAILPGEPQDAVLAERGGVEVGAVGGIGQGIGLHLQGGGIDPDDGVEPAVGHPGGAVRPDDHAVRRRFLAQRHLLDLAALGIEPPERALALGGVPHRAVGSGRYIMGSGALGDRKILHRLRMGRRHRDRETSDRGKQHQWPHGNLLRAIAATLTCVAGGRSAMAVRTKSTDIATPCRPLG